MTSAFAQFAPYELAEGAWHSRREEIGDRVIDLIETYAPDLRGCMVNSWCWARPTSRSGSG